MFVVYVMYVIHVCVLHVGMFACMYVVLDLNSMPGFLVLLGAALCDSWYQLRLGLMPGLLDGGSLNVPREPNTPLINEYTFNDIGIPHMI